jgi:hypothetical protein
MSLSVQKRRALASKLERLKRAAVKAEEDLMVAIYEARQEGLTQRDVAHHIGDGKAGTTIASKEAKGKAIKEARGR